MTHLKQLPGSWSKAFFRNRTKVQTSTTHGQLSGAFKATMPPTSINFCFPSLFTFGKMNQQNQKPSRKMLGWGRLPQFAVITEFI